MTIPFIGPVRSLRFITEPAAFLAAGHDLQQKAGAPAWGFWLNGSPVYVVTDQARAAEVLQPGDALGFFHPDPLVPFLGRYSPLWVRTAGRAESVELVQRFLPRGDPKPLLRALLTRQWPTMFERQPPFDAGDLLRVAAMWWATDLFPDRGRLRDVLAACVRWLAAADTSALFVRPLRLVSRRWRWLAFNRVEFLRQLGLADAGPLAQDAALTVILGAIDNPVTLALEAIWLAHERPAELSPARCALRERPPVPLIVRQAEQSMERFGIVLHPGDGLAVDAARSGLPFGAGEHRCPFSAAGLRFVEAAVDVVRELKLAPAGPPQRRRTRLSYGACSLVLTRRRVTPS